LAAHSSTSEPPTPGPMAEPPVDGIGHAEAARILACQRRTVVCVKSAACCRQEECARGLSRADGEALACACIHRGFCRRRSKIERFRR
jgi:hypothetical protein